MLFNAYTFYKKLKVPLLFSRRVIVVKAMITRMLEEEKRLAR